MVALLGTVQRAGMCVPRDLEGSGSSRFLGSRSPHLLVATLCKPVSQRSLAEITVWAANLLSSADTERLGKKSVAISDENVKTR